jgi:hypothetical protein
MPDITVTLTDAQLKVVRKLDAVKTAKQVVQAHVDTWLLPLVQAAVTEDREGVKAAYIAADPVIQAQVRGVLGLG